MESAPTLPRALEAQLDRAALDVYQQAFDAFRVQDNSSSSADISRITGESILRRAREAISSAQRGHNGRLSLQNRLPTEVLCNVWQNLSFSDRIAVSHVCGEWRDAALNSPPLWKHVEFYTTRHSLACYCTYCKDQADFEDSHAPGYPPLAKPGAGPLPHFLHHALPCPGGRPHHLGAFAFWGPSSEAARSR
ncbi:hypothetical protein AURDEDRAFT_152790, partial [Auricularia subglabra TFB-10046 SS5]